MSACALMFSLVVLAAGPSDAPRPDILIVIADDMNWQDIELAETPNLDRLMERGLSFTRAYANPVCSPSRVAALTGAYSFREHIGTVVLPKGAPKATADEQNPSLGTDRLTLPELLKPAGYATLAAGKCHLGNALGGIQWETMRVHGFDHFLAGTQFTVEARGYFDWQRVDDGQISRCQEYNTTAIVDAVQDWWSVQTSPRFCWLAFNAPHKPLHVPPLELLPEGFVVDDTPRSMFEAAVTAMDTELGRLLESVDLATTLVIFISDNGTPGSAAPEGVSAKLLKGSLKDGGVRVPLILAGPGVPQAASSDALVNLTDLFRTLAELLELDVPAGAAQDSVSFLPLLGAPEAPGSREWVYSEFFEPNGTGPKTSIRLMLRNATHKLIWTDVDGVGPRLPQEFLLQMEADHVVLPDRWTDTDREAYEALDSVLGGLGPAR